MNLKQIRIEQNKKQCEIAEKLNIPKSYYSRYENEQVQPDIETLIKIANYFEVSLDYLCGNKKTNEIGYIDEQEKEIIRIIKKMNERQKNKVLGYCLGITEQDVSKNEIK